MNQEVLDVWTDDLEDGLEAPIAALILPLLPNLRTIRSVRSYDFPDYLEQVLGLWEIGLNIEGGVLRPEHLVEAAIAVLEGSLQAPVTLPNTGPGHNHAATLCRVIDIVIAPSSLHHRAPVVGMIMLARFLAIPSSRTIYAERAVDTGPRLGTRVGRVPVARGSLLKTLTLENCRVFGEDLLAFLTPVKALESFSYSFHPAYHDPNMAFFCLVDVLLKMAGHSLRILRLKLPYTGRILISRWLPGRIIMHMPGMDYWEESLSIQAFSDRSLIPLPFEWPYLRGFRQLKVVRIRTDALRDKNLSGSATAFYGIAEYGIPLLFGHFLPPSIETFELSGEHIEDKHLERMLGSTLKTSIQPDPLPPIKRASISGENTQRPFLWEGDGWARFLQAVRRYLLFPRLGVVVDPDVYPLDDGLDRL